MVRTSVVSLSLMLWFVAVCLPLSGSERKKTVVTFSPVKPSVESEIQAESPKGSESADADGQTQPHSPSRPTDRHQTRADLPQDASKTEADQAGNSLAARQPSLPLELLVLRTKIRRCLDFYFYQHLNAREDSPWSVMHGFIAYGVDTLISTGAARPQRVNAISWLCANQPCGGVRLLYVKNGRLKGFVGPGLQGHEGQFLAMLAQSRVGTDYPLIVNGQNFTVADLIEAEKLSCRQNMELTFKLVGLCHYLDTDAVWVNEQGEPWSIPKLIHYEIAQPINGATCGGTHRLMGLSYAYCKREDSGRPLTGQWKRAQQYIHEYHRYTFQLQNRDGSFSTSFFRGREDRPDIARKLETTGHIVEWLVFSLPKENLLDRRLLRSVDYLTNLLIANRYYKWAVGPKGHALHALALFDERVFGRSPGHRNVQLASSEKDDHAP